MVLESNRELVLRRLLECLARDRTKHQVAEVTSLGLVQMTRKRVGAGLLEAFSEPCECCNGRGLIISLDGAEHAGHTHRSRPDNGAAKEGKGSRDGKAGKDGKGARQGKAGREDQAAERKATAQVGNAQVSNAVATIAQASLAQAGAAQGGAAQGGAALAGAARAGEAAGPGGGEAASDGTGPAASGVSAPGDPADDVSVNNVTAPDVAAASGVSADRGGGDGGGVSAAEGVSAGEQDSDGPGAGQPAAAAAPQSGGRRRRAATREPGPPDSGAGTDGQAPAEASAGASV
jgi:ribonuclease E